MIVLFQMVGASFILVQLLMVTLWVIYYFQRNAGIVDIGWAMGFLITAVSYFILGEGDWVKTTLLLVMVGVWSARLVWHLWQRYRLGEEDARYRLIRERWGQRNSDFKFLVLFVFQGVLVILLSLPFLLVACCPNSAWSPWEMGGVLLWAIGVSGEYYADEQLSRYKNQPHNPGEVYRQGLWRYTRHPNYFFEWIVWLSYAFFALSAPAGFLAFLAPIIMYYLLRYVSGVPMVEAQLVRTKGEAYRRYQATTSEFFPWIPKHTSSSEP